MPIPRNTWKALPLYIIPPTGIIGSMSSSRIEGILDSIFTVFQSSTYSDGSPRVTGSGVAWTFLRTSSFGVTNGVTDVVWGYPPTMSMMSQSVIFAGTSSANGLLPNPYMGLNAYAYGTNQVYVAIQKQANWSQYRSWFSGSIFNSGSSGRNTVSHSGFFAITEPFGRDSVSNATIGSINAWECGESVALAINSSASLYARTFPQYVLGNGVSVYMNYWGPIPVIAGAFIDPLSSDRTVDAEDDGRLYSLATCAAGISYVTSVQSSSVYQLNFYINPNEFLKHTLQNAYYSKFVTFTPNTTNTVPVYLASNLSISYNTITSRGQTVPFPLTVLNKDNNKFIGKFRDIVAIKNSYSGYTIRSGSVELGYTLGCSPYTIGNVLMFLAS
jgi:hypothetical protein